MPATLAMQPRAAQPVSTCVSQRMNSAEMQACSNTACCKAMQCHVARWYVHAIDTFNKAKRAATTST